MKMTEQKIACGNKVPNSLAQIRVATKYTLLDYVRSRRFYILLSLIALISIILTVVVAVYRPAGFLSSELAFYNGWWGTSALIVIALIGVFFGGDAISGEFQNKTGYFVLPNPVRRSSIYVGKWLAAFIASSIILGVFAAITVSNGLYYFGGVPYQFGYSLLFAWFYLTAVLGFTFFFSSLFKNNSYSILVSLILFLFAFTLIQQLVSSLVQIEPWFILTYGGQIIGNVLTTTYPAHLTTSSFGPGSAATLTTYNATIPEGLAIIAVYFIITAIIGLLLFERKEFT